MKAKQIIYSRLKSEDYNNQTIGIVLDVEDYESAEEALQRAKDWVAKQLGEEVKESYEVKAHCNNCGKNFDSYYGNKPLKIPCKQTIESYPCPECGCVGLVRDI